MTKVARFSKTGQMTRQSFSRRQAGPEMLRQDRRQLQPHEDAALLEPVGEEPEQPLKRRRHKHGRERLNRGRHKHGSRRPGEQQNPIILQL